MPHIRSPDRYHRPRGCRVQWVRLREVSLSALAVVSCWSIAASPGFAQLEGPAQTIAAQIRMQGFRCDDPRDAQHEKQLSRPNEQVWVLRCGNATYRITLIPDMAARVERLQ
jgi:hypothetical protein